MMCMRLGAAKALENASCTSAAFTGMLHSSFWSKATSSVSIQGRTSVLATGFTLAKPNSTPMSPDSTMCSSITLARSCGLRPASRNNPWQTFWNFCAKPARDGLRHTSGSTCLSMRARSESMMLFSSSRTASLTSKPTRFRRSYSFCASAAAFATSRCLIAVVTIASNSRPCCCDASAIMYRQDPPRAARRLLTSLM